MAPIGHRLTVPSAQPPTNASVRYLLHRSLKLVAYRPTTSVLFWASEVVNFHLVSKSLVIHSFITEPYIAPLQGYYSETLPTLARLKEKSFEAKVEYVRKNPGEKSLRQRKPIPHRGPTTENARVWVVELRAQGTKNNLCSNEPSKL